jgi:hypothetical protein
MTEDKVSWHHNFGIFKNSHVFESTKAPTVCFLQVHQHIDNIKARIHVQVQVHGQVRAHVFSRSNPRCRRPDLAGPRRGQTSRAGVSNIVLFLCP